MPRNRNQVFVVVLILILNSRAKYNNRRPPANRFRTQIKIILLWRLWVVIGWARPTTNDDYASSSAFNVLILHLKKINIIISHELWIKIRPFNVNNMQSIKCVLNIIKRIKIIKKMFAYSICTCLHYKCVFSILYVYIINFIILSLILINN